VIAAPHPNFPILSHPATQPSSHYDQDAAGLSPLDSAFWPRAHVRGTKAVTPKSFAMCVCRNARSDSPIAALSSPSSFPIAISVQNNPCVFNQLQMPFLQPLSFHTITNARGGVYPSALIPFTRHSPLATSSVPLHPAALGARMSPDTHFRPERGKQTPRDRCLIKVSGHRVRFLLSMKTAPGCCCKSCLGPSFYQVDRFAGWPESRIHQTMRRQFRVGKAGSVRLG
jgi:hypothetical protein